ncbi:hypothetical protein LIER_36461 [Lithospermum erythrorhizon]|uniref:Uncharacterized protein n=1 Tax=Lithospermum erythrorhizon TaxID=34254 RepID=A0AAV3P6A9_LITER
MELFNVFDWAAPGCLGNVEHFRDCYDEPLKHGQRAAPTTLGGGSWQVLTEEDQGGDHWPICGSPLKQVECCKRTVPDGVMWPYFHKDNPEGCDSCPYCLVLPCLVKLQQEGLLKSNQFAVDDFNSSPSKQVAFQLCKEFRGILYAHRNEDIVNYKPRIQEDREGIIESDDVLQQPSTLATWKRKSDGVNSRKSAVDSTCSKMQKKNQYKGMSMSMNRNMP